jgi:hypothetical protein
MEMVVIIIITVTDMKEIGLTWKDMVQVSITLFMLFYKIILYLGKFYFKIGDIYDIYDGEWLNDQIHGKGAFTISKYEIYNGMFKNGDFDGFGSYAFNKGNKYGF